MLLELKVKHFAIIDSVHIEFRDGFNILSGETGAGKSILLKSLALLMGEKALSDTVKTGHTQASIEGLFDLSHRTDVKSRLEEMGIEDHEDVLVVRRVINSQGGKSRVYLNGNLSTLSHLREVVAPLIELTGQSAPLIEMTGQHENRHLQSPQYHLDLLDSYTGSWKLRNDFQKHFENLTELKNTQAQLESSQKDRDQKLDFLNFQRDEIAQMNLEPGDDQKLELQTKRLKNLSRLDDFVHETESSLYSDEDSALVRLHRVLQRSSDLAKFDDELSGKVQGLEQAKNLIEESVYELREHLRGNEHDPSELPQLEEKLAHLRKLQRKFGPNLDDILAAQEKILHEIDELENFEEKHKEIETEILKLMKSLESLGDELHKRRANGAELLAQSVREELKDLNMKGLIFSVSVKTADWTSSGGSEVEFLTQSSKSDSTRSLARFASGGELSRILLALKCVIGTSEKPRTYLFDEVDTGVSGETAEKVGKKLRAIGRGQQVICVTHLPQVARYADVHFLIEKSQKNKNIEMQVKELKKTDQIKEIARLISGEKITKTSLDHARQLLSDLH